jgi:hypothetical protein
VIGGGPINRTISSSGWSFRLAFDKQNNPYLFYVERPDGINVTANVVTLDPESLNWTTPIVLQSGIANEPVSLEAASNGDIYASFVTSVPSAHYVYQLYRYAMETD